MDFGIIVIGFFLLIIFLAVAQEWITAGLIGFIIVLAVMVWTGVAMITFNPPPKVTYREFKRIEGEVFYKDNEGKLQKARPDLQYIDIEKFILKVTVRESDWHMGILITSQESWEVVEKASIEK